MGQVDGFKIFKRSGPDRRQVADRVNDYFSIYQPFCEDDAAVQAARCMDCGVPTCQDGPGCPLGNRIPVWNDLVSRTRGASPEVAERYWKRAYVELNATNNFPEFTAGLCPAPCETACVEQIYDQLPTGGKNSVAVKGIEGAIIHHAFEKGWVVAQPPRSKTSKTVAIVGSGPAGLAAAQQLARAGHEVTVFEKADQIGGLLRYGIPNFKMGMRDLELDKNELLKRRIQQMEEEGVTFVPNSNMSLRALIASGVHTVLLTVGAEKPRALDIEGFDKKSEKARYIDAEGRELGGIHYAMEYLIQQNRRDLGLRISSRTENILATGLNVVVLGGGDTGADCMGTAARQKAQSATQMTTQAEPTYQRGPGTPWPQPFTIRIDSSLEEGGKREFTARVVRFEGNERARVQRIQAIRLQQVGPRQFRDIPGSEFTIDADLVLVALGFRRSRVRHLLDGFYDTIQLTPKGTIETVNGYETAIPGVFAAGDSRIGSSLVVNAIWEGRQAAKQIDQYLRADEGGQVPALRHRVEQMHRVGGSGQGRALQRRIEPLAK